MSADVARFEFRYLLRNPLVWVTAAVTFATFAVGLSMGREFGSEGGLLQYAALATLRTHAMASVFFMFVTTVSATSFAVREMPVKTSIR